MDNTVYYKLQADTLPAVTLLDTVTITPPYIHYRRKAEEFILYYILSGEMHLTEQGHNYLLKPNDIILLDPSHEHFGTKSTTCQYFYIHFYHGNMNELTEETDVLKEFLLTNRISSLKSHVNTANKAEHTLYPDLVLPKYYHVKQSGTALSLIDELYKMKKSHHGRLEHHTLKTSCMLMEFFVNLSRELTSSFLSHDTAAPTTRSTRIIHDLLTFLYKSYDTEISSDLLEDKYGCNFDYINRIFKKTTGKTIFVYLNELRIAQAKQLLSNGIYSISEVADKTGFHDVYYFSKVFKKYAGMNPGAYLKQLYSL